MTTKRSSHHVDDGSAAQESWALAEQFAGRIGEFPSLFTAAVRAVRSAPAILHTDDAEKIQRFAIEAVDFPVRVSPTLKAALYHLGLDVGLEGIDDLSALTYHRLLQLYKPDQLIAVIALTFLHRTLRKFCDDEEWDRLAAKLRVHLQVGHLVGERIEMVGPGNGMFMAGLRCLAQIPFALSDLAGFKDVRRAAERKKLLFDASGEEMRWHCSHLQIAAGWASEWGYGIGARLAFGMLHGFIAPPKAPTNNTEIEMQNWKLALSCIEALHARGAAPDALAKRERAQLGAGNAAELERRALTVVAEGRGFKWIELGPKDLPDDVRTALGIRPESVKKPGDEDGF